MESKITENNSKVDLIKNGLEFVLSEWRSRMEVLSLDGFSGIQKICFSANVPLLNFIESNFNASVEMCCLCNHGAEVNFRFLDYVKRCMKIADSKIQLLIDEKEDFESMETLYVSEPILSLWVEIPSHTDQIKPTILTIINRFVDCAYIKTFELLI